VESITATIVASMASGVTSAVVKDAYSALKTKLFDILSSYRCAMDVLQGLEQKPKSSGRQNLLNEELLQTNFEQSGEIQQLLKNLLKTPKCKEALSKYNINGDKVDKVSNNAHIKNQRF
jgi:hypothetical protein